MEIKGETEAEERMDRKESKELDGLNEGLLKLIKKQIKEK